MYTRVFGGLYSEMAFSKTWALGATFLVQCKKSVLKIQEYIHEGGNLKFYIPEFLNFELLIPEHSPILSFGSKLPHTFSTVYTVKK
jgi:hypothetical protein